MRRFLLSFSLLIFSTNLFAKGDLATLSQWMQGAFNSQKQAEVDKDFFNIHLYMKQAWKQQNDGIWLYVEQAAEGYLDKPYRQRVYHLTQLPDGRFSSKVYSFDNALSYAGDWKKKSPLETMTPADLKLREGCAVFLRWDEKNQSYSGETDANKCSSKLRGATYATSKVIVFEDRIESWDQGFDAADKQVWGAIKSGYVFDRQG